MLTLEKAVAELQNGQWSQAIEILKQLPRSFQVCNIQGVAHQMSQDWFGAVSAWEEALRFNPQSEDVRLQLGIANVALGNKERAEGYWLAILEGNAHHVQSLINLGILYREQERNMEAHGVWERALEILPTHPKVIEWLADVKGAIGSGLVALGKISNAESYLKNAVSLDPTYSILWGYLSEWHFRKGEYPEALVTCQKAVELEPDNSTFYHTLGNVYRMMEEDEKALEQYRQAISLGGKHISTIRAVAELEGIDMTENHERQKVMAQLFDQYATHFDQHLQGQLEYQTPQQALRLYQKINRSVALDSILDLGCGTGLSIAPFMPLCSPNASRVGVDLSAQMLAKAKEKRLYTDLHHYSLESFLGQVPVSTFSLVLCLDTFVYISDLQILFAGVSRWLTADGLFIFSTENTDLSTVSLQRSGRYAHPVDVVQSWLAQAGLSVLTRETVKLRKDGQRWVEGNLWCVSLEVNETV